MKHRLFNKLSVSALTLLAVSLTGLSSFGRSPLEIQAANASLPKENITLRDNTEEEIRSYYSSLNSKEENERKGANLLKNLKPILKENMLYFSYDNVWKVYEITDRDWELSPAINDTYNGTSYDPETMTYTKYVYGESGSQPGNDPYVHTLYRDRSNPEARIKEWGAHSGNNATNREHVWCQSRGFKGREGSSAAAYGPAGTDVHHLMSGDCKVNTDHHNDKPYGNVDKTKTYRDAGSVFPWLSGNLCGSPIKTSSKDQVSEVFEPRDEDKGDIARACFYMVARYNNLAGEVGVISDYEPNLALADYATGTGSAEYSTDDTPVYMGIMSDLLEWNRLDPVDDYEIHRNNLIYNNYQHNRNPFIDFPEWADLIWGDNGNIASPATDEIAVGENGPRTPSKPITPTDPDEEDAPELPAFISEHLDIIIPIAIGVAVILIIVVIVLVAKGKAKIKVRKGEITVVANKPTSKTKKKISANSTKNTADKKEAKTAKKASNKNTKKK